MKDIRDYLKYYIGQPVWIRKNFEGNDVVDTLTGKMVEEDIDMFELSDGKSYKPILRKLESMSEDEMIEMLKHFSKIDLSNCIFEFSEDEGDDHAWVNGIENGQVVDCLDINLFDHTVMMMDDYREVTITLPQSETFHYLLSRGVDLFQLIENNLAVDKATIK